MKDKILSTIEKYSMIHKGDTVASCLSGGRDSMALFHFLCSERENLGINIIALHVNHGLRTESEEEEVIVKSYCKSMGVECIVCHLNMTSREKPQGMSVETWARDLRYKFFEEQAEKYSAKLATAHTLSDKTETILFNITRGTGLKGVTGIPPVRGNIIRPLIDCTREEIENYCKQNNIRFVTDKTNFDDVYSRNRIRLNVIPQLKMINSSFEKSVANFSEEAEELHTLLSHLSDILYKESYTDKGYDTHILCNAEPAVAKNLIRNILDNIGCLSKNNVDDIYSSLKNEYYSRQMNDRYICIVKDGFLTLTEVNKPVGEVRTEVSSYGTTQFLGKAYMFSIQDAENIKNIKESGKNPLKSFINYDKIKGRLFLRNRKIGDSFSFTKRKVTKTVKKLFIEDKVPISERDRIPILTDETDKLIWMSGYGTDRKYVPDTECKKVLIIEQIYTEEL